MRLSDAVTNTTAVDDELRQVYQRYEDNLPATVRRHRGAQFVPGYGPANATVTLVGEAPGHQEDIRGRPFVGPAGDALDDMLLSAGAPSQSRMFVTNVMKHRPPSNATPKPWEIGYARPYLSAELNLISSSLVILAGGTALAAAFPGRKLSVWAGEVIETRRRKYLVIWHPAACLRDPEKRHNNRFFLQAARPYGT